MNNLAEHSLAKVKRVKPKGILAGGIWPTKNNGDLEILEYIKGRVGVQPKVKARFVGYTDIFIVRADKVRTGAVKNLFKPNVRNVGFVGRGKYKSQEGGKNTDAYQSWVDMFRRCYCSKYHKLRPTYEKCTVDPIWHNFQEYAEYFERNPHWKKGFHNDKDLKVQGNKVYSPETCVFVDVRINNLINVSSSSSKYMLGVHWYRAGKEFRSYCQDGVGNNHYIGTFSTETEAHQAYCKFKYALIKKVSNLPEYAYIKEYLLSWVIPKY